MYEKHLAREAYLESPPRFVMELFCKENEGLLTMNYFRKKFLS